MEASADFALDLPYSRKMLTLDTQTSGGILLCAPHDKTEPILAALAAQGCPSAAIIGRTTAFGRKHLVVF